ERLYRRPWRGDEDDLKHPESDVRDREGYIIAYILATGLFGVAGETGLLIAPNLLCGSTEHQDAEDEEYGEPDFAHHRGVFLGTFQKLPKRVPVSHYC
uniref:Uncharacterized protein n=1 Tax=Sinocyclocheilus rhinocerous TaxID=307959 RepID=A0A673HVJ2_9TELE